MSNWGAKVAIVVLFLLFVIVLGFITFATFGSSLEWNNDSDNKENTNTDSVVVYQDESKDNIQDRYYYEYMYGMSQRSWNEDDREDRDEDWSDNHQKRDQWKDNDWSDDDWKDNKADWGEDCDDDYRDW